MAQSARGCFRSACPEQIYRPADQYEQESGDAFDGLNDDLRNGDEERRYRKCDGQEWKQGSAVGGSVAGPATEDDEAHSHGGEEQPLSIDDASDEDAVASCHDQHRSPGSLQYHSSMWRAVGRVHVGEPAE